MTTRTEWKVDRWLRSLVERLREGRVGLSRMTRWALAVGVLPTVVLIVQGFPPAPDHVLYGVVRDETGQPLVLDNARVLLQTPSGEIIASSVRFGKAPGVNYTMAVPMDAGLVDGVHKPTAMRPHARFTMRVVVRNEIFLPLELTGDLREIGRPGEKTRLDLTLGVDLDGDGLPDAWEQQLLSELDGVDEINPGDDADGDGLTNLEEYLSGSYAGDEANEFALDIVGLNDGIPVLEFRALRGRTYSVEASTDLIAWEAVAFRMEGEGTEVSTRDHFGATDVRDIRIEVPAGSSERGDFQFFKLIAQ